LCSSCAPSIVLVGRLQTGHGHGPKHPTGLRRSDARVLGVAAGADRGRARPRHTSFFPQHGPCHWASADDADRYCRWRGGAPRTQRRSHRWAPHHGRGLAHGHADRDARRSGVSARLRARRRWGHTARVCLQRESSFHPRAVKVVLAAVPFAHRGP
jgi:hypothetical protein